MRTGNYAYDYGIPHAVNIAKMMETKAALGPRTIEDQRAAEDAEQARRVAEGESRRNRDAAQALATTQHVTGPVAQEQARSAGLVQQEQARAAGLVGVEAVKQFGERINRPPPVAPPPLALGNGAVAMPPGSSYTVDRPPAPPQPSPIVQRNARGEIEYIQLGDQLYMPKPATGFDVTMGTSNPQAGTGAPQESPPGAGRAVRMRMPDGSIRMVGESRIDEMHRLGAVTL